jgi:hypothetical protein
MADKPKPQGDKDRQKIVNAERGRRGVEWLDSIRKDGGASASYNRDAQTGANKFVRSNGNPRQKSSASAARAKAIEDRLNKK